MPPNQPRTWQDLEQAARGAASGDQGAFRWVVEQTNAQLVRMAARMLGNLAEAEDIVQEAYIRAHQALVEGRFDGRSKVATWLYRIAANLAIDGLRRRRRQRLDPKPPSDQIASPSCGIEAHLALVELDAWLGELPEEQRAALVLSVLEGLTNAEVATILKTSEGGVEQRLVRARVALRKKGESSHD